MIAIQFAPLQGYTDDVYRRLHHELIGGIRMYYTPFLRVEGGGVRKKDVRDIAPEHNSKVPVVPQIILKSFKEFEYLVDVVEERGYTEIDINMGCPFPMQAKHGRGAGLLAHTDVIEDVLKGISDRPHLRFSVKMRTGWEDKDEWRPVLNMLNDVSLRQITLHPRLGIRQYKGEVDMNTFEEFYNLCKHPLVYNGDIQTIEDINRMESEFPNLAGLMIGRGLLARPSLAVEYQEGNEWTWEKRRTLLRMFHDCLKAHYEQTVNSEAQLHARLRIFWEYMEGQLEKKTYKRLMKSGNLKNYLEAVRNI